MSIRSLKNPGVLIPLVLFVGSLLLRLMGIGWGLANSLHNQSYHPDETVNYGVSQSLDIAHGKLSPGFYNYGTAYFIAENIANKVVDAYGGGTDLTWAGVSRGILVGRVLNALAGAGTVAILWLILRRITTRFGALFGAGLVGLAPGFLVHSRFETVDVFATFWLALSALFSLRILGAMPGSIAEEDHREPRDIRDAVLAGVFAGISTGSKYTGILVLVVLWVALGLARRPGWWKPALVGTVACFCAFVLTTPGFATDSTKFWADFGFELGHSAAGHGLVFVGTAQGYLFHLGNLIVGLGTLATVAGFGGLVFGCYRRHSWAIALLVFALVYYAVIGHAEVKFLRYTFPLLLPLGVGYGYAMGTAFRKKTRRGMGFAVVGFFALTGNPFFDPFGGLIGSVGDTYLMLSPDSRDEAATSLKAIAASGTVGFVEDPWFYSPPLIPDAGLNRDQIPRIFDELAKSDHPKVLRYLPPDPNKRIDWDVRLLSESKPDYVVFSSFEAFDLDRLSSMNGLARDLQGQVEQYRQFLVELDHSYKSVNAFGLNTTPPVHDMMYIRPTLWVWKRKDLP